MPHVFPSNFTFGNIAAEHDPLLPNAYWDNGDFAAMAAPHDPRCFIIGRVGSGKSAAFQHLEDRFPGQVVRIQPEQLAFKYLTNLRVTQYLLSLGVQLDPFLRALWKHVLIVEILRHRYILSTPAHKQRLLAHLRERVRPEPAKLQALTYLEAFGDHFWCEADERVRQIAETFARKIDAASTLDAHLAGVGLQGSAGAEQTRTISTQQELAARYQSIVNETQLPRLNEMIRLLDTEILDAAHFTYVIIDDLDEDWVDSALATLLIRCLFQAVVEMQPARHLKILVALRTNLFQQLEYGAQPRGQEEKISELALYIRWTETDLRRLLDYRAAAATHHYQLDPPRTRLTQLLPRVTQKHGDPIAYILHRTQLRPRDAIMYLNHCVREAAGKERISWADIYHAERKYSASRLTALRDEWKDPYNGIDQVLERFRHQPARVSRAALSRILDDVALLLAESTFPGSIWLAPRAEALLEQRPTRTWYHWYGPLVQMLYNISFLGMARSASGPVEYRYAHTGANPHEADLIPDTHFVIHPAFQQALGVTLGEESG